MQGRTAVVATTATALLLAGYGTVDAVDRWPQGWPSLLTTEQPWAEPTPFPTVSLDPAPSVPPVLPAVDGQGPLPDPERLVETLAPVLADPATSSGVGAVVLDVVSGEVLLDHDGDAARVPASTVKLLTTAAALIALGPETRLATRALAGEDLSTAGEDGEGETGAPRDGAVGTVHLVAGGDVLLAAGAGDDDSVLGRAGLADLAAQTADAVRARGVTEVRVALDDTLFTGPTTAPGWGPVDLGGGFVAPVSPIAVDRGIQLGRTARDPDPGLTAARTFATALAAEGIVVAEDVVRRRAAPSDAAELASVESATVAELVEHTLQVSDNDVAEVLGRLVAVAAERPADFAGGTAAIRAALGERGLDVARIRMVDASGLSEQNAVPPVALARLVALSADPARPELLPVATGMPVAGLEGTLAMRFEGATDPAAGVVRAKTGTLLTVVALAGLVLDADDRLLAFAVVADRVPLGAVSGARESIDGWVSRLAACGCS